MSAEIFEDMVRQLCETVGLPDAQAVLDRGVLEIEGFDVLLRHFENDEDAMYLNFDFGIVTPGRALRVYQLMLESNLTVYAQDQAQLGCNPDTRGVVLIVRVPFAEDVDGAWLADTLKHYAEHGRYWRGIMNGGVEEMYENVCAGDYVWLRA